MSIIPLILLLLLIILYVNARPKSNKILAFVLLISIIFIVCLQDLRENFANYAELNYKMGHCSGLKLGDGDSIAPLVQTHDNIKLGNRNNPSCKWRKSPCNLPLASEVKIYNPVGQGEILTQDPASNTFPTLDGTPDTSKSLFMFAHNQCRPECCPGTHSCDRGCICTTAQQRKFLNRRGGNHQTTGLPQL